MKHLFKKGLSLLLAVLMVTSALPMSTLAANLADSRQAGESGVYSTQVDTDPPQAEPSAEIGEDITDPVEEVTPPPEDVTDPTEDAADPAEDDLRAEVPAGEDQNGDRPEKPGDGDEEPDDPAKLLWDDLTLTGVIDPETGNYTITVTSSHINGTLGSNGAFALVPDFGNTTLENLVGNDISNTSTAAEWSDEDALATWLGVDPGCISIQNVNGQKLDADGNMVITGSLGMSFDDYLKEANKHSNGGGLTVASGIPMTVILVSSETRPGVNLGHITFKKVMPHALLGVPDEIVLSPGQESETAPVSNDERPGYDHTPNINVRRIRWGGTGSIDSNGLLPTNMAPDGTGTINLDIGWVDNEGNDITNITGVITVIYDVIDPENGAVLYRDLEATIPVRTVGPSATPIEVTVWTTDDPDTPVNEMVAENLTTKITVPDDDGALGEVGVTHVILMNAEEYEALTYMPPGWSDSFVGFTGDGAPELKWVLPEAGLDESWLLFGMTTPIDGSAEVPVLSVTAGTAKGDYVGVMNIAYIATDGYSTMGSVSVPVIIHVKAIQGEAVFHRNLNGDDTDASAAYGGSFTGDANTKLTNLPSNPIKSGSEFKGWATSANGTPVDAEDIVYGSGMKGDGKAAHYYAIWETTVQTYDVTYHLGTGESWGTGVADPSRKGVTTHVVTMNTPTKTGSYDFLGWTTVSDGTATSPDSTYAAGKTVTLTADLDLYPVWAKLYTITYTNPGATGVAATETAPMISLPNQTTSQSGKSVSVSTSITKDSSHQDTGKRYYTFKGWSDGTTTYDPGASFTMPAQDVTLTAQWELEKVTVTLDPQGHGASGITSPWDSTNYDQTINKGGSVTMPTLSETGWTFKGWDTNASATTGSVNGGATVSNVLADVTYHAIWTETQYTVTFNPNGGTWDNAPTTGTKTSSGTYSATVTVPDTLTRSGYAFKEWNDKQDGTGTALDTTTDTYGAKSGKTYYAIWDQLYTVNYQDATDTADHTYPKIGASLPSDTSKKSGDPVTVKYASGYAVNAEMTNTSGLAYKFTGWTISPTVTVTSGAFSMPANNVTLTATWEPVMQKVTYKHNGMTESDGSPTPDYVATNAVQKGANYTISVNDPVWTGHAFGGWTVTSGATSASGLKKNGTVTGVTGDVILTAQWETIKYSVTFDPNGGAWSDNTSANKTTQGEYADKVKHPTETVKRTGYTFGGWFETDDDGNLTTTELDTASHTYGVKAGMTYKAKWTRDTSKIVFDLAGGNISGNTDNIEKTGNTSDALPVGDFPANPSRTNYRFNGWSNSYSSTNLPNFPSTKGGTLTITAQWVGQSSVTFDVNNGTWVSGGGAASQTGDVGTNITMPTAPTREGYDFAGWKKGTETPVTSGIKFPATAGATDAYVAQWTVKQYTVTFLWNTTANSHTLTEKYDSTKGNYGAAITKPTNDPGMTGYTFGGWYTDADCSTAMSASDTYPANNDGKMYAKWTANSYKVTYKPGLAGTNVGATIDLDDSTTGAQTEDAFTYDGTSLTAKTADVVKWTSDAVKAGWSFTGWKSNAADGTKDYAASASLATNKKDYDFELTAQWTIDISYDANLPETTPAGESSLSVPSTPAKIAPSGRLSAAQVATPGDLTNWTFAGWYTTAKDTESETGVQVAGGASGTVFDKPSTIYARWTPKQYTVSFVDNSGDSNNPAAEANKNYGTKITLPASNGTKTGYTFDGWYKETALTNKAGDVGDDYTVTKTETLYGKWVPVDVTVTYNNNGVGTGKPADATATYDAAYTTADATNATTGITGGTWSTMADGKKMFTETATGKRYRFDGWEVVGTSTTLLGTGNNGVAAINPVNTTNGVVKTTADGKDTYTLTLKATWTQLFTITYAAGGHGAVGTQPSDQANVTAGSYTTKNPSDLIAATGASWEGSRFNMADGTHWQFDGWSADGGTTKITAGNPVTITNDDITLTAVWTQQYKVTMKAGVRTDETTSAGNAGGKLNSTSTVTWSHNSSPYVYVTGAFTVADPQLLNNNSDYIFVKWKATNTGAFTNGVSGNTTQSTNASDTFTPTADTELTPVFALKPKLSPTVDGYQLNFATGANVAAAKWQPAVTPITKPTNTLPTYTWTAGDATIGTVTITAPSGVTLPGATAAGTTETLTLGTEYTYNATTGVIQFQRAYLLGLEATKSYTVTVNSTTNGTATPLTATLWAVVTPDPLLKVEIGVKPDTAADYEANPQVAATPVASRTKTASVTVEARNVVKYLDHAETTIIPSNLLTYQWYYAPTAATIDAQTSVSNLTLPTGAVKIGSSTTDNFVNMDNDAYKGKYIFATVVATGTGKNAVVTNSIPVDYDAVIKVTKDGSASITSDNYTVYLLEQGTSANAASYAAMPASAVGTTNTAGTNQYKTGTSALTGGKTYDIYVNKVEGNTTLFVKTGLTVKTQTNADAAPEAKFYSVNAVKTDLKHAEDKSATPQKVGESFGTNDADAPATKFYAEGVSAAFDSGMGVFTGSKVTAKASKTWSQDYDVNWGMKESADATAPTLSYGTENQNATNAAGTGKDYANIKAKTWIGAQLEQNTYTITGNVWVNSYTNGSNAGIDASTGKTPTLTYENTTTGKTYTFTSTVASNGVHKSVVTFTGVPRSGVENAAIAGQYVVEATAKSSNTKSTIIKYIPGQNTGSATDATIAAVGALTNRTLAADIPAGGVTDPQFTVVLAASTYILKATDTETSPKSAQHSYDASTTAPTTPSGNRLATQGWTGTFAGITAKTYTVVVSNQGNMALDVKLNIKRTMGSTDVYVYGASAAGTDDLTAPSGGVTVWTDSDNNVTFGALQDSFTLAPKGSTGDSVTFTVTIPTDLTVNNAADYAFELTSMESGSTTLYGPSVTYKLTQTVDPRNVTKVAASKSGSTLTASGLEIDNSASIPTGVTVNTTDTASGDVVYEWYAVPYGSTVALNASGKLTVGGTAQTSIGSGVSYTATASEAGKDVYVVARGVGMSGNVLSAARSTAITMTYDLKIQVNEDSTPTASKDNYTVYLWPTDGGTFNAATAIAATATADADGRYLATGLQPGKTYDVYTNAVGDAHSNYQKSGTQAKLSDFTGSNVPVVTYRSVTINNTTTDNSPYSFDNSTTAFIKDADGSTTTLDKTADGAAQKPTAALKADASVLVATTDANKWVQQGTKVTVTYLAWGKDYDLTWDVGAKVTDEANPATGDVTVDASKTINSKLTLNLYTVTLSVDGPGTLSEVTMNDGTNDFTASAGSFHATGSTTPPIGKGTYTFTVPKGTYTVLGTRSAGTDILYYKIPASSTTEIPPANISAESVTVADNTSSFHIQLNSVGQYMLVEDDQKPVDNTIITAHNAGTAGSTGTAKTDGTAGSTIHLPYGYTVARTVTVTVANNSAGGNHLYDVTWTPAATGNSASITAVYADLDGSKDIMYTYGGTVDDPLEATLTVATGLAVGTHTYTADVTFNDKDSDATYQPKVTYTLTVVVDPTKFTAVTVSGQDASGNVALGDALSFATYTTEDVDDWTNGKNLAADEYTYQWYHGPADKTATESWSAGTATVKDATAITGATGATLAASEIAKYPGEHIYLVISAVKDKNVIEAAISAPVTTGFQPVVKVSVDGTDQSTVSGFDGTDYTATIDDGTTTWNTVWSDDRGGFVPVDGGKEVSLDATKTYTAKVSRVKGDSTNLVALDDKLSNTSTTNTVTAPYFTVNAVETKAFEGITGMGEDFGGDDKLTGPAVSLALSDGTALTSGTPVLSGQGVKATTATWTQDYELTWYTRMDGAATVPTRNTAYEGTTPTMTAQGGKVDSTSASGTGYTVSKVTNKLYVGGRLDQIKYTVVGTVKGTGTVKSVALEQTAPKTADYIYPDTTTPATSPVKPTSTSGASDGSLAKDETVTFTVVKGTFTITPTEGANTVIKKVAWEGTDEADGVTVLKDKTVQLKATDPKRTYNFVITVEGADVKLKVSDDAATATSAESNPNAWNDAKNGVERYFNYIHFNKADSANADTYEYVLTLTNAGNKELKVNAEVYHFDTAPATGFGADASKWNTTKATGTKVYETADGATATLTGVSGETVLGLSEMMAADTIVAAKDVVTSADGSAKAGKITLGADAWSKDTGAYVFHFMGVTNDADATKVDVYYVLDLKVNQLPIVKVETNNSGSMVGVGETITALGYDADSSKNKSLDNVTVKTSTKPDQTNAAAANLTGNDVHFAWVKVDAGATAPVKANLSVKNDGTLTSTVGTVVSQSETYTLVAGDQDKDFYLVAFAPNYDGNVTNATDMAISAVVKAKRTVGVIVTLNGFKVQGLTPGYTDPGYEVYLVESGKTFNATNAATGADGTWATTWNTTSRLYEAGIDVDNTTYEVYAVSYKDGATVLKAIDGTLGKQASGAAKTEEIVPYWDVTFTENVAVTNTHDKFKSYLPSGAAGTDNAIQKALSVKVSTTKGGTTYETAALTASTTATSTTIPVLAGMNVKVTVDATKTSNNTTDGVKKSWSETDVQPLHTLTTTGWTDTASKNSKIAYAASIASGDITVNSAQTFSAKLDQALFDVVFTVKDISEDADGNPTPSSRTKVRVVTLTPNPAEGETGVLSSACACVNGEYGNGDTVTIKNVPVGSFEVKATPVPGTPTLVKGYTWNAEGDALNNPVDPGKIVTVTVPGTPDNNKHAGNTIQVIEATKVVNWSDTFDENTGGILADGAFNPSNGFVKADNTSASPKRLFGLTEGYTAADAVLEYTVRVTNGGTDEISGFHLTRAADSNFTYDLTNVTWHKEDGSEVKNHDATAKFPFGPGEYLEFTMTIPEGQVGQKNNYTTEIVPHCDLNLGETLGGGNYKPEYQVKTPVKFKPGEALVLYGGSEFESSTDIALDWPTATTDETEPTFTYEVLQLSGTGATADAAILAEINGELGLTLTTLDAKPSWLTANAGTGAITFTTGDHATGVNVKVKGTPADFDAYDDAANGHKVKGEITLYIRATDTTTDETYIIPYVVDVEPGQLKIEGGSFTPATTIGGQLVDKSEFTYTKVTNQATTPLDVIAASDITGGGDTAKGNTTAEDGTVNVNNVHTATWTVAPERYVSEVSTKHTFTVTYKPEDAAEKWNYKPATHEETIVASKPALGLTFGDVLGKSGIEQADAELKIGRAPEEGYHEILTDGNKPYAPEAMEHNKETYRKGEYIVYLDTEPKYTVTLTATGNLKNVKVEETLVGFKVVKGDLSFTTLADGEQKVFELELDMVNGKWVGEHTAKYTVTGTGESGDTASATYELVFTVKPKTIPKAHVTELTDPWPDQQPDKTVKVTGEQPTDPDKDVELDKWTDKHGNHPIKPPVVTVTPDEPFKDGKDYTVTVELTADPNYTFEDETPEPEEPNYTAGDKAPDDDYTVTVTEDKDPTKENEKVTFTKTTPLPKRPVLKFEDVNANNAGDKVAPSPEAVRPTITIVKGQALGKYLISLGAYGETVTDVDITQTGKMPDGTDWVLEPASVEYIYNVESDTAGDKKVTYTLDMTGVDTSKLAFGTYTMSLRAVGKNVYGEDVPATYKITVQVVKAPAGELRFDDVKTGGDTKDPDALGPDKALKRLERLENPENPEQEYKPYEVVKGDELGTYTINLGAYGNTVNDVTVTETELKLPDGTVWALDPTSIATMTPGGDKTTYILDLTGVDTAAAELGVYTLKLKAEGTDINGDKTEATYEIAIEVVKAPAPVLKFDDVNADRPTDVTGPEVHDKRNISQSTNAKLGKYIISLGAYGGMVSNIKFTEVLTDNFIGVYGVSPDCEALAPVTLTSVDLGGGKQAFELDLSGMDTKTAGTYTLTLTAKGVDINGDPVEATYTLTITLRAPGGGGGGGSPECPKQVTYLLGLYGTTTGSTMEMVSGSAVKNVPPVTAVAGYKFLGWSLISPNGDMEQDAKRAVVDPKTVTITKDTVFYAVYQPVYAVPQPPIHKHYVIGYPNGNFGPADNIDRASVATIIARAVLPNFVEGADYGNPGGYTDVSGHWAASAIAYCSKYGVFKGYEDGTFKPGQPISRQELALVMARLNGVQTGGSVPFTDIGDAGAWAVDGIYTAYINGWVNGYTDGTFKPVNPIRRDETVKIFNAYLGRGVNAEGLEGLSEYVHSGVASNNTEDGTSEYMTWPDVTKDQWAYYEIIEAANDHEFTVDSTLPRGYAVPEQWTKCWIDEKWRYHDDANDGGPSAVVGALMSKYGLAD